MIQEVLDIAFDGDSGERFFDAFHAEHEEHEQDRKDEHEKNGHGVVIVPQ